MRLVREYSNHCISKKFDFGYSLKIFMTCSVVELYEMIGERCYGLFAKPIGWRLAVEMEMFN